MSAKPRHDRAPGPIVPNSRQELAEALRLEQERTRQYLDIADVMVLAQNRRASVLLANRKTCQVLGYEQIEIAGRNWFEHFVPPEMRWTLEQIFHQVLEGQEEETVRVESSVLTRRGEERLILWRHTALRDGEGRISGVLSSGEDITERMITEAALSESAYRYRLLFERSKALHLVVGPGARIVDINTALGYAKEEAVGRNVLDLVVPGHRPILQEALNRQLDGQPAPPGGDGLAIDFTAAGGSVRSFLFPPGPPACIYRHGRLLGILYTGIDITDRKAAQARIRQQERELLQASKLAMLGTLVAGIAHEINNPNHFIRLIAQNLRDFWQDIDPVLTARHEREGDLTLAGIPYPAAREMLLEMLDGLEEGSRRIEKLIQSLKCYALQDRDESHPLMNIRELILAAEQITGSLIRRSTSRYTCVITPDLPRVRGNPQQIQQVLINLLTNACQALSDRSQAIALSAGYEESTRCILLSVRDEGSGIPADQLNRITDPFFTTRRDSGGTGLGLAIAERIARSHHGVLAFESRAGSGTTACLRLPVERSEDAGPLS